MRATSQKLVPPRTFPKHSISRYNISFLAEGNAGDWIGFRWVIAINDGTLQKDRWQVVKYKQFPKRSYKPKHMHRALALHGVLF